MERSGELGSNMRQRYGSHVDIAKGKYQQMEGEENDGDGNQGVRWR